MQPRYRIFCTELNGYINYDSLNGALSFGEIGSIFATPYAVCETAVEFIKKYPQYTIKIEKMFILTCGTVNHDNSNKNIMDCYNDPFFDTTSIDQEFENYIRYLDNEYLKLLLKRIPNWKIQIEQILLKHS